MAEVDKSGPQEKPRLRPPAPTEQNVNDALRALGNELQSAGSSEHQSNADPGLAVSLIASTGGQVSWIGNPAQVDQQLERVLVGETQAGPTSAGESTAVNSDRRSVPRQQLTSLVCATVDSTNGGILLNVGRGGAAIRLIDSVLDGRHVEISFPVKPNGARIKASGQVAWIDSSCHTAGVQFRDLPSESQEQLETWLREIAKLTAAEKRNTEPVAFPLHVETSVDIASPQIAHLPAKPGSASVMQREQTQPLATAENDLEEGLWEHLNGSRKWIIAGIILGLTAVMVFGILTYSPAALSVLRSASGSTKATADVIRRWIKDEAPPIAKSPAASPQAAGRRSSAGSTSRPQPSAETSISKVGKREPVTSDRAFPAVEVQGNNEWRLVRNPAGSPMAVSMLGRRFQVSYEISGPAPEKALLPPYPSQARQHNIQGEVVVRAVVGSDGNLGNIELSGDPAFVVAVEPVLKTWRYEAGKPRTDTRITVRFTSGNQ